METRGFASHQYPYPSFCKRGQAITPTSDFCQPDGDGTGAEHPFGPPSRLWLAVGQGAGFPGGSVVKNPPANANGPVLLMDINDPETSIPGSGRCLIPGPGEGNGNPL